MAQSEYSEERKKVVRRIRSLEKRGYKFPRLYNDSYQLNLPTDIDELQELDIEYLYDIAEYSPTAYVKDYMRRHGIELPEKGETLEGKIGKYFEEKLRQERSQFTRKYNITERKRASAKSSADRFPEDVYEDEELGAIVKGSYIIEELRDRIAQFDYGTVYTEAHRIDPNIRVTQHYVDNIKDPMKNLFASLLENAIEIEGEDAVAARLESQASIVDSSSRLILYGSGGKNGEQKINEELARFAELIKGSPLSMEESKRITDYAEANHTFETPE